jgi:hypothetical protein
MARVAAGELTREQADQESLRQGAGRIYDNSLSTQKADLARDVWRAAFGPDRPLTDAKAAELGNALTFRQGLFPADLLHTPRGAERKALTDLRRKAAAAKRFLDELVTIRAAKDGDGFEGVTFAATGPKGQNDSANGGPARHIVGPSLAPGVRCAPAGQSCSSSPRRGGEIDRGLSDA